MAANRTRLFNLLTDWCAHQKRFEPLVEEIDHHLYDVEHEEIPEYDIVDAFEDVCAVAESQPGYTKEWNLIKEIYVHIGYVDIVDPKDPNRYASDGKKYWFIYKGYHYDITESWESWIQK